MFYKFLTILQKSLMSTFVLNVPPNRNFGDAIAAQDLRGIQVWNLFWCSPLEPKSWSRPCIQYILYIMYICRKQMPRPFRHSARVPSPLRSRSVCVPSTMSWPSSLHTSIFYTYLRSCYNKNFRHVVIKQNVSFAWQFASSTDQPGGQKVNSARSNANAIIQIFRTRELTACFNRRCRNAGP